MEKKMNNKGFSLVELIVVIAIMAVLVGVLAPQFIKYVEKSRQSTDITNLDSIKQVVESYYADREGIPEKIQIVDDGGVFVCKIAAKSTDTLSKAPDEVLKQGGVLGTKVKGTWDAAGKLSATWDTVNNTWTYVAKSKYYTTNNGNANNSIVPE